LGVQGLNKKFSFENELEERGVKRRKPSAKDEEKADLDGFFPSAAESSITNIKGQGKKERPAIIA